MTQPSTPDPTPENDTRSSWIDRIARQSTGLQKPEAADSLTDSDLNERRRLWKIAGRGFQFAAVVVVFYYMGHEVDKRMGWGLKATITLTLIGLIGGFYLMIKEAMSLDK